MEATWYRAAGTALSTGEEKPRSFSIFYDYDLGNWTFGLRSDIDPCWYDLTIQLGPISVCLMYWRPLWQGERP